jgi:uncharacterized protein (TIGR00730 family)
MHMNTPPLIADNANLPRPDFSVCVFCGSRLGHHHEWAATAADTGKGIADRDWGLVFGAGRWGLMGTLAQAAIEEGGWVSGIIPRYLTEMEPVIAGLADLQVVETMVERKVRMVDQSNAFLILPGGIGTYEELFEVWTGRQTGSHDKPILIANLNGFYDKLLDFVKDGLEHGFLTDRHMTSIEVHTNMTDVFASLEEHAMALQQSPRSE